MPPEIPGISQSDVESGQIQTGAQQFNVNPVGLNLGEILKPYTDSFYNGGFGVRTPSPNSFTAHRRRSPSSAFNLGEKGGAIGLGVVVAIVLGVLFFFGLRR